MFMTTTPTHPYAQFGQTLAFAERTLTESLRRHLSEVGATPPTWYALKLITGAGNEISRDALISDLSRSRELNRTLAEQLVERLEADGIITGDDRVSLTTAGQALFNRLYEHVIGNTVAFLGQFDLNDIETTIRTLRAVTERAEV
jgi:DNA-binding MarR family transcriptional regulator